MWKTGQDARAVAGVFITPDGTAMGHIEQNRISVLYNLMTLPTFNVGDKPNPTVLVLELWRVQTMLCRPLSSLHVCLLPSRL